MDDIGVGRVIMLARQRRNWRQVDLGAASGVSQQLVANIEAGALDRVSLRLLRAVAAALEIQLPLAPRWRGGEVDRLRDRDHAAIIEVVAAVLGAAGWIVVVEYTYNHFGERGAVDVVGWHPPTASLAIVEVKTRIYDEQALLGGIDRKARLVPRLLAEERGWVPRQVGRLLVMPDITANRSVVGKHAATFGSALPARGREVRMWLRVPSGGLAGVWFLSLTTTAGGNRVAVGRRRVRVRNDRDS